RKPSGSIRWSVAPDATQSRPMEPVFCGISGATRTTCTGSGGGKPDPPPADGQHDLGAGTRLRVAHEVVVRGPQPAGFVGAALHAAVEDVLGADAQRRRVEGLAGLVVEHDGEALLRVALHRRHHPRRVLDEDVGPVLAQLEPGPPVGQHLQSAAEEPADGAVRDELVVAVPVAVLAELDLPGADRGEAGARHQMPPAVSRTKVTGPSLTSATAIVAWKRPVATGRRVARAQATKRSESACAGAGGAAAVDDGVRQLLQDK